MPSAPEVEPSVLARSEPASALFVQGFDVVWRARPHRFNVLELGADASGDPAPRGALRARVHGGSWASGEVASDVADATLLFGGLARPGLIASGVRLVVRGGGNGPDDGVATVVEPLGPGDWLGAAVWLTGFRLRADPGHPDGYTVRTLAVGLDAPVVSGGVARFEAHVAVGAGPVLDRYQNLSTWGATAEIDYLVVPIRRGESAERLEAHAPFGHPAAISERLSPAEPVFVRLAGHTGGHAVAGLSSWRFALEDAGRGAYVRALTVAAVDHRHDPLTGWFESAVQLRFSNAGEASRAETGTAGATLTVVRSPTPFSSWSGRAVFHLADATEVVRYP